MSNCPSDPVLKDVLNARILVGLSGASVYLVTRDERSWFVRKAARETKFNHRLRLQAMKQRRWGESIPTGILTPKILDEGEIEGRYYFDMELIRGVDAVSYLHRSSYSEINEFAVRLAEYIVRASKLPPLVPAISPSLFDSAYAKIAEVWEKVPSLPCETVAKMFLALERLRNRKEQIAPTLCHGDLTLENMIITADGSIYAVDMLDFAYPHYWLDIAKLHQDLSGGWFIRNGVNIAPCVTDHISAKLLETAIAIDPFYSEIHNLLLTLTFIRILPYAQSQQQISFINRRIEHYTRSLEG